MTITAIKTNLDGWEIYLLGDDTLSIINTVSGAGTSISLGQEAKVALMNALELSQQWAAAGTNYFILYDGLDFTLVPYNSTNTTIVHTIPLNPYEKDMLSHILRAR